MQARPRARGFLGYVLLGLLLAGSAAQAGPFVGGGPFVDPLAGAIIPRPRQVPGKEYTDFWIRTQCLCQTLIRSFDGMVSRQVE